MPGADSPLPISVLSLYYSPWQHTNSRPYLHITATNRLIQVEELYNQIMKQVDEMHLVRQQTPSTLLGKLRLPLEKDRFEERMKSWILTTPLEHGEHLLKECKKPLGTHYHNSVKPLIK
jgi:hypothetical protein